VGEDRIRKDIAVETPLVKRQFGRRDLRSSGMLHNGDWLLATDVSGQPIGPIFMEAVQEDGTDRLSRNVVNYYSTLRNFPKKAKISFAPRPSSKSPGLIEVLMELCWMEHVQNSVRCWAFSFGGV
jgi:hypothetical protein